MIQMVDFKHLKNLIPIGFDYNFIHHLSELVNLLFVGTPVEANEIIYKYRYVYVHMYICNVI